MKLPKFKLKFTIFGFEISFLKIIAFVASTVFIGLLAEIGPYRNITGCFTAILIHEDHNKHLLIGEVHLFGDSETPKYGVILGEI